MALFQSETRLFYYMKMKTFVTSDPHFYHANIIKYCDRPFANVDEMNDTLRGNWNSVVSPEDVVYVIGDFALVRGANPNEKLSKLEALTRSLNGVKHLIIGNHDKFEPLEYICCGFESVANGFIEENINNHLFVMCHYQMTAWNKSHHGAMHLFGHQHWKQQYEPKHSLYEEMHWSERKFNVCMDANGFTPVDINEIIKTLEKRPTNFEK